MKNVNKLITIYIFVSSILLSSCGAGQVFGPTITPSPTTANTPSPTPTATATLTSTATFTPEPTATKTPLPTCKSEIFISKDLKDFGLFIGEKHTIEKDNDVSVSKVVNTKGRIWLSKAVRFSEIGNYLISVDVKRNESIKFSINIQDSKYGSAQTFEYWEKTFSSAHLPKSKFGNITSFFVVNKAPVTLYVILQVNLSDGTTNTSTTAWLKNLQICLID